MARAAGLDRDGLGQELRLDRHRLRRHPELRETTLCEAGLGGEPFRQAGHGRLQQLHRAFGRARQQRREPQPRDVERLRERQRIEVADRDHPALLEQHERVLLRRVQLDLDTPPRERKGVARSRPHLRDAAEAERILEVARGALIPQVAALEQRREFRVAVQRAHVRGERLEVEGRRNVEHRHEPLRVGERERGERGREGVVAEEREPLLRSELEVAEHAVGKVGVRGQVGHADRAERPYGRCETRVELRDETFEQLDPHARGPTREAVGDEQELRAHDICGRGLALADAVLEDQPPVELGELAGLDARSLAHADTRRQAVNRQLARERALDYLAAGAHPLGDAGGHLDGGSAAGDREQVLERERFAAERDRHGG
jgi:hypothetical protein